MNLRDLLEPLRRPWSKPTLVLVTALVAGAAGYSVAATRPEEKPPVVEPSIVAESWLGELERETVIETVGRTAKEAKAAAPPGVELVRETVIAQNPNQMSGGLIALPAGKWRLYASCRPNGDSLDGLRGGVSVTGDGTDRFLELDCPVDAGEVLLRFDTDSDTLFTLALTPLAPDGHTGDEEFWDAEMAVGIFIAAA